MHINKYQDKLPRQLYICSLVFEEPSKGRVYRHRIKRNQIHELAVQYPHAPIVGGNINTHLFTQMDFVNMKNLTLKYLDDHLDDWVKKNSLLPELYVVGGYYPRKDFQQVFSCMHHDHKIYIFGLIPTTELPVFRITDTELIRCKYGSIPSPSKYPIYPEMKKELDKVIPSEPLYFI